MRFLYCMEFIIFIKNKQNTRRDLSDSTTSPYSFSTREGYFEQFSFFLFRGRQLCHRRPGSADSTTDTTSQHLTETGLEAKLSFGTQMMRPRG
jgi:hypothetical protein